MKKNNNKRKDIAAERQKAMPDVKRLVKRHGRTNVVWCLNQLKEYQKKVKQLAQLKKEAEKLEREIK